MKTRRRLTIAAMILGCGCAASPPRLTLTMPSPDGCFVQVWDGDQFTGTADFINGPLSYATLREMPGRRSWDKKIRSMKVGPTAAVTVWTGEHFAGTPIFLSTNSSQPVFAATLAANIKSMNVHCMPAGTDVQRAAR